MSRHFLAILLFVLFGFESVELALATPSHQPSSVLMHTALLVDKATNSMNLVDVQGDQFKILKNFHATLGKIKGDKHVEGDHKTPEGIYTFKTVKKAPKMAAKLGNMAFHSNYPNDYDRIEKKTGSAIMLHGTNTPSRLKLDYDSEGCVVLENEKVEELSHSIRIGLTPFIIYEDYQADQKKIPTHDHVMQTFLAWIKAWESRQIEDYMSFYHPQFKAQGKNVTQWKAYKNILNRKYQSIQINPEDIMIYRHPKYSVVTFVQNYQSKMKNGSWGMKSRGTKIVYFAPEKPILNEKDAQQIPLKVVSENYTGLMW
jgi:murein L,D-transpeptidase YafK